MRRTITERRATIEDALREQLSETTVCDDGTLPNDRPRVAGQVFLAVLDGLEPDRALEQVLPIAVALELASLQTSVHRSVWTRDRGADSNPTSEILTGDVLEAKAFELLAGIRGSPRLVERCIATLVRATRRAQEGDALLAGRDAESSSSDADVVHRLGALPGGAAELAGLVAGADEETRRRLGYYGSAFGFHIRSHTAGTGVSLEDATVESASLEDGSQWIDAIADCCPPGARPRIREQLAAVLEDGIEHEAAESIS